MVTFVKRTYTENVRQTRCLRTIGVHVLAAPEMGECRGYFTARNINQKRQPQRTKSRLSDEIETN